MCRCRAVSSENDHYHEPLLSSLWPLVNDPPVHACWHSLIERDRESGDPHPRSPPEMAVTFPCHQSVILPVTHPFVGSEGARTYRSRSLPVHLWQSHMLRETSLWCVCTTVTPYSCSVSGVINALAGQVGHWWKHILICCWSPMVWVDIIRLYPGKVQMTVDLECMPFQRHACSSSRLDRNSFSSTFLSIRARDTSWQWHLALHFQPLELLPFGES